MASGVRTTDVGGWLGIELKNQALQVLLLPDKGSEILEFRDRTRDLNLLWRAPMSLPAPGDPVTGLTNDAWLARYVGGWQELFPNAGDAVVYDRAWLGFHGEASVAPWTWQLDDTAAGPVVALALTCRTFPLRIEKRLHLDADRPVLHIWERVVNLGDQALPVMWGHHPAYGAPFLAAGCQLDLPANAFESDAAADPDHSALLGASRSTWPQVAGKDGPLDMSKIPGPEARASNLGYAMQLRSGWYALRNPALGLGIGLVWPVEVFPYVWLWQEFRGNPAAPWSSRTYVMGIEPHTSYPGHGLQRAIAAGTARWLQPGDQLEAELTAVLFADRGSVSAIAPDGTVTVS